MAPRVRFDIVVVFTLETAIFSVLRVSTLTPPVVEIIVYDVIGDPLLFAGAVHVIVAEADPATALTLVGGSGVENTVTEAEGLEATELPTSLLAITVNV